jgi:oligopeptide transport system permease protein
VKIFLHLSGLTIMWLFVTLILILIVLLPRGELKVDFTESRVNMTKQYEESITTFSWESYKQNIVHTFQYVKEHKSLGQTVHLLSVEYEVWRYFRKSLIILVPAAFLSMVFGILKGVYDFSSKRRKYNLLGEGVTNFFLAVPDFFIILSTQLIILAIINYGFPFIDVYGSETWSNKILAILFLSMYPMFYIAKITNSAIGEQAGQDYVRTALSKGISIRKIVWRHMLGNCWLKIISHFNTIVLYLLSNLFIVEFLMGYRGGAYRFYKAFEIKKVFTILDVMEIDNRVIIGFVIIFTFIVFISQVVSKLASLHLLRKEGNEI